MIKTILFFSILLSSVVYADSSCEQFLDDCEYYSCIENEKNCGRHGYPIGFGKKYCLKFEKKEETLSEKGQEWMKEVRSCLIQGMESFSNEYSCRKFKKESVRLHVPCYVNSGYCSLSKSDKRAVIKIIRWSTWRPSIFSAGLQVLNSCRD